jgi:glycosyltransferase involved in cell wall biosynthesis
VFGLPEGRSWSLLERLSIKLGRDVASAPIMGDRTASAVLRAMRERGLDILIMEETQGWAGYVQRLVPIPVVVTLHGPWFLHKAFATRRSAPIDRGREARELRAMKGCAGMISPSRSVMNKVCRKYDLERKTTRVIPNPIPVKGEGLDYDHLCDDERSRILFVGRFDATKGGDIVLSAFSRLIQNGADARLTFVGPDAGLVLADGGRRRISEALSALPDAVRDRIRYEGPRAKEEIDRMRRRHGVTVLASRYENFPYTLLESLAVGAATVSADAGGPAEIIRDGETGLLVPAEDPVALAVRRAGACCPTPRSARGWGPPRALTSRSVSPRAGSRRTWSGS